jgi:hypothetical protein
MLRPVLKTRFHISASETVASAMNRGMFISGLSRMPFCTSLPFVATTVLGHQDELSVDLCSVPVAVCDGILASRLSKPRAVRIASQLYGLSLGRELALEVLNPGTPSILLGEMFVLCKQWCSDWSLKREFQSGTRWEKSDYPNAGSMESNQPSNIRCVSKSS